LHDLAEEPVVDADPHIGGDLPKLSGLVGQAGQQPEALRLDPVETLGDDDPHAALGAGQ